jgi:TldD protein
MRSIAETALSLIPGRVRYADVRVVQGRHEGLVIENEVPVQAVVEESLGIGIRVLVGGQWGFAATGHLDESSIGRAIGRAIEQAAVASGPPNDLAPADVVRDRWESPMVRDPFEVPIGERTDLLIRASADMRRAGPEVASAQASVDFFRNDKVFASTEGSLVEQRITETGGGLLATATDGADMQRRSYPQSVPRAIRGQRGDFATAGWEHVLGLGLDAAGARVGEEAVALLRAPACPSGTTDLIIGAAQMALVVHETCGHPAELDRALGGEASLAGGSYMQPQLRGQLVVGSPIVNVTGDATLPGAIGSYGYDDEGVPAQRVEIIRDGVFNGYLSSRGSAAEIGVRSTGAARADGWRRIPLVRMTNVSLEPGTTPLEEIIAGTRRGLLVDMNRSLSIDDQRRSFRFGSEIGWEIRDGKLGRMLKNCSFSGDSIDLWRSCDAIADRGSWRLWGLPSCNKGEPLQVAHVGHGTVPARFRGVRVGVS